MNRSIFFFLLLSAFLYTTFPKTSDLGTNSFIAISANAAEKKQTAPSKKVNKGTVENDQLPELTRTMHDDLLEAAAAGDLEELRDLFESNELAPVLSEEHINDPLEYWKKISIDNSTRDIMASLAEILSLPAKKTQNGDFVWPYLSEIPLKNLTTAQQIDLFRLVGPKQAIAMLKTGKYNYYTTKIGKDGTWHHFKKPSKTK